jgi:hypothetical protein
MGKVVRPLVGSALGAPLTSGGISLVVRLLGCPSHARHLGSCAVSGLLPTGQAASATNGTRAVLYCTCTSGRDVIQPEGRHIQEK